MTKVLMQSFVDLRMLTDVHLLFFPNALSLFTHFNVLFRER